MTNDDLSLECGDRALRCEFKAVVFEVDRLWLGLPALRVIQHCGGVEGLLLVV